MRDVRHDGMQTNRDDLHETVRMTTFHDNGLRHDSDGRNAVMLMMLHRLRKKHVNVHDVVGRLVVGPLMAVVMMMMMTPFVMASVFGRLRSGAPGGLLRVSSPPPGSDRPKRAVAKLETVTTLHVATKKQRLG
jgi:hypothetical protein